MSTSEATDFPNQIRRATTVIFIVGGAVVGGVYLALLLLAPTTSDNHLALAAAGLGVSTLATILKDGSGFLPKVKSYVVQGRGDGIYPLVGLAGALAITVTGFAWAVFVSAEEDSPDISAPDGPELVYVKSPGTVAYVLPFFEEAKLCTVDGSCDIGVALGPAMSTFLEGLAENLVHCGSEERPVEIRVSGFASSSRFRGRPDSDALNLRVADRRAKEVAKQIRESVGGSRVEIVTRRWEDYGTMFVRAGYKDTDSSNVYSVKRGILNRRVEITLVDPSDCAYYGLSVDSPQSPAAASDQDIAAMDSGAPGALVSSY